MWDDRHIYGISIDHKEMRMLEDLCKIYNLGIHDTICLAIRELYKKNDRSELDE